MCQTEGPRAQYGNFMAHQFMTDQVIIASRFSQRTLLI